MGSTNGCLVSRKKSPIVVKEFEMREYTPNEHDYNKNCPCSSCCYIEKMFSDIDNFVVNDTGDII